MVITWCQVRVAEGTVRTFLFYRHQETPRSLSTSTGHIWWSGVRCRRSVYVELTAETFTRPF